MTPPSKYLIDELIDYAAERGITFSHAADIIGEFAKQRAPERRLHSHTRDAQYELQRTVHSSPRETIIARFFARTRVHYIMWPYYPEFHVIDSPRTFWWCSIWFGEPSWKPTVETDRLYLDDLFHDPDGGRFWMHEPYLNGLPESALMFRELTKAVPEKMEGTSFHKVDPHAFRAFREKRTEVPEFTTRFLEPSEASRRPPYGAKGWQSRIKHVPITYKRVRLKS